MGWMKWTALSVALLALAPLLAGQLGLLRGQPPADLGVKLGRLKPPSKTPNSVSSQAGLWPDHPQRAYAQIAPLAWVAGGSGGAMAGDAGAATMDRLRQVLRGMPGAQIQRDQPDYLHATFESRWMRYVDDVEFWLDRDNGVVQLRSASRLGRRDFGVNRARIEAIRQALGRPG